MGLVKMLGIAGAQQRVESRSRQRPDAELEKAVLSQLPDKFRARAEALGDKFIAQMSAQNAFLVKALAYWPAGYVEFCRLSSPDQRIEALAVGKLEALGTATKMCNTGMVEHIIEEVPASLQAVYWGTPEGQEALIGRLGQGAAELRRLLWTRVVDRPLGPNETFTAWQKQLRAPGPKRSEKEAIPPCMTLGGGNG